MIVIFAVSAIVAVSALLPPEILKQIESEVAYMSGQTSTVELENSDGSSIKMDLIRYPTKILADGIYYDPNGDQQPFHYTYQS